MTGGGTGAITDQAWAGHLTVTGIATVMDVLTVIGGVIATVMVDPTVIGGVIVIVMVDPTVDGVETEMTGIAPMFHAR